MGWFSKIPLISLLLLIATYGVFGWLYSDWILELISKNNLSFEWLTPVVEITVFYIVGLLSILVLISCFTTPITLLTLGMGNWFKADTKAILSITISIVIFALVIEYPGALGHFLVLSAAAMLFRLDLQTLGFSYRFSQLLLIGLSLIAFTLGMVVFYFYEV